MPCHRFPQLSISFMTCSLVLSLVLRGATVAADGIITDCTDKGNTFSRNSTFEKNLNLLFSTLSSRANTSTTIGTYSNATVGGNTTDPVYGLFVCRGDATPSICGSCVAEAIGSLRSLCFPLKPVMNGYSNCMFRYSGNYFFGKVDTGLRVWTTNNPNVTSNATGFNRVLGETLNKVASSAASGSWTLKYGTAQGPFGPLSTVYALGQCTPDLSPSGCYTCLQTCISDLMGCCGFKQLSGWVLYASCNLRYANTLFYQTLPPQPSPSPINTNGTNINIGNKKKLRSKALIGAAVGSAAVGVVLIAVIICQIRKKPAPTVSVEAGTDDFTTADSLLYDFSTLQVATNDFSHDNKLGEGGFGAVFKGIMPDGQEVAVKRLSKSSRQGVEQFKNEVVLVAKLQHRNLVRLLGFCLASAEKLLVYEYVSNSSLDHFLFDPTRVGRLIWSTRYKIIEGIARGMLYLHEDSQLRIIHRDLKASNVLLDSNMNPKVSDFGTARIFGVIKHKIIQKESWVLSNGYMSPEYAMQGHFSIKSDVYSFGVLVLEIISGKSNSIFQVSGNDEHLMSYAWKAWWKGNPMEFADPSIINSCSKEQVLRCIHIGLSCVQDEMDARPSMASVLLMLNNNSTTLPTPRRPAFIMQPKSCHNEFSSSNSKTKEFSVNQVPSLKLMQGNACNSKWKRTELFLQLKQTLL